MLRHSAVSHTRSVCEPQHSMYTDCSKNDLITGYDGYWSQQRYGEALEGNLWWLPGTTDPLRTLRREREKEKAKGGDDRGGEGQDSI